MARPLPRPRKALPAHFRPPTPAEYRAARLAAWTHPVQRQVERCLDTDDVVGAAIYTEMYWTDFLLAAAILDGGEAEGGDGVALADAPLWYGPLVQARGF